MADIILDEFLTFVLGFVETNNECDAKFLEDRNVVFGREAAVFVRNIEGSAEGHKLLGQNPIQVTIFNFFVVLVLLHVEVLVIVPTERHSKL